jgi:hypothetical protein
LLLQAGLKESDEFDADAAIQEMGISVEHLDSRYPPGFLREQSKSRLASAELDRIDLSRAVCVE